MATEKFWFAAGTQGAFPSGGGHLGGEAETEEIFCHSENSEYPIACRVICHISKIELVVYYQCSILIG